MNIISSPIFMLNLPPINLL